MSQKLDWNYIREIIIDKCEEDVKDNNLESLEICMLKKSDVVCDIIEFLNTDNYLTNVNDDINVTSSGFCMEKLLGKLLKKSKIVKRVMEDLGHPEFELGVE